MDSSGQTISRGALFVGRYKVDRLIGEGGMGKVYLAYDTMLSNEPIALKILDPKLGEDENLRTRFLREVQLTRKVNHPNVVRTFDVGSDSISLFFTMEYVAGETLKQRINSGPIDPLQVVQFALQICDGLHVIHETGIIHRDLKAANIILDQGGKLKIMDFGVAKPSRSDLTQHDELIGSATHMAPEVWQQGDLTPSTDLYALGVVLYELLTGVLPFDGQTPHELMWKHLKQAPTPLIELNPQIPRWFEGIVLSLLSKNTTDRPPSASYLSQNIQKKMRRSTLEDARQANVLGVSTSEPHFDENFADDPIDPEESSEEVWHTSSYKPGQESEQANFRKVSFSAQPAVISALDLEEQAFAAPGERLKAVRENIERAGRTKRELALKGLQTVLRCCFVASLIAFALCIWGPFMSHPGLRAFLNMLPLPVGMSVTLLSGLVIIFTFSSLPLIFVRTLKSGVTLWLRCMAAALCLWGLLSAWFLVQLVYWSYQMPGWRVWIMALQQSITVGLYTTIEVLQLKFHGSIHRVLPVETMAIFQTYASGTFLQSIPYYLALVSWLCFVTLLTKFELKRNNQSCVGMAGLKIMGSLIILWSVPTILKAFGVLQASHALEFGKYFQVLSLPVALAALPVWFLLFRCFGKKPVEDDPQAA